MADQQQTPSTFHISTVQSQPALQSIFSAIMEDSEHLTGTSSASSTVMAGNQNNQNNQGNQNAQFQGHQQQNQQQQGHQQHQTHQTHQQQAHYYPAPHHRGYDQTAQPDIPFPPISRFLPSFQQLLDIGAIHSEILPPSFRLEENERETLIEAAQLLKILSGYLVAESFAKWQESIVEVMDGLYAGVKNAEELRDVRAALREAVLAWRVVEREEQGVRWKARIEGWEREKMEKVARGEVVEEEEVSGGGARKGKSFSVKKGSMMERFVGIPYQAEEEVSSGGVFKSQVSAGFKPSILGRVVDEGVREEKEEVAFGGGLRVKSVAEMMAVMQSSRVSGGDARVKIEEVTSGGGMMGESSTNLRASLLRGIATGGRGSLRSVGPGRVGLSGEYIESGKGSLRASDRTSTPEHRFGDYVYDGHGSLRSVGRGRVGLSEEYVESGKGSFRAAGRSSGEKDAFADGADE